MTYVEPLVPTPLIPDIEGDPKGDVCPGRLVTTTNLCESSIKNSSGTGREFSAVPFKYTAPFGENSGTLAERGVVAKTGGNMPEGTKGGAPGVMAFWP